MNTKEQIEKMHWETCVPELKEASRLTGKETEYQLDKILEKCQCIQIPVLLNTFISQNRRKEKSK